MFPVDGGRRAIARPARLRMIKACIGRIQVGGCLTGHRIMLWVLILFPVQNLRRCRKARTRGSRMGRYGKTVLHFKFATCAAKKTLVTARGDKPSPDCHGSEMRGRCAKAQKSEVRWERLIQTVS
jgi:hypothetical protein